MIVEVAPNRVRHHVAEYVGASAVNPEACDTCGHAMPDGLELTWTLVVDPYTQDECEIALGNGWAYGDRDSKVALCPKCAPAYALVLEAP